MILSLNFIQCININSAQVPVWSKTLVPQFASQEPVLPTEYTFLFSYAVLYHKLRSPHKTMASSWAEIICRNEKDWKHFIRDDLRYFGKPLNCAFSCRACTCMPLWLPGRPSYPVCHEALKSQIQFSCSIAASISHFLTDIFK